MAAAKGGSDPIPNPLSPSFFSKTLNKSTKKRMNEARFWTFGEKIGFSHLCLRTVMPPRRSARGKSASVEPPDDDDDKSKKKTIETTTTAPRRGRSKSASAEPADEEKEKEKDDRRRSTEKRATAAPTMKTTTTTKNKPAVDPAKTKKKKKTSSGKGAQTQPEHIVDETNRLKRETAFLCPMQFRNNLPPPRALDWKLLRRKGSLDDDMMAEHNVALLYDELRRSTRMFSEDLGINLDPIGSDAFRAAKTKGDIHPDDLILLANDSARDKESKSRSGRKPDVNKAMWLMNTKYISEGGLSLKTGISEKSNLILKRQRELREQEEKLDPGLRDYNKSLTEREKQILAIKKSFEAAEKLTLETATHPRNKSLKPVSVTPVFPDFKVWPQNFVRLTFDEDPTLDVEGVSDAMEDVKEKAMQKAIVKPMMVEDEAGRPDKFIALMLPKDAANAENVKILDENENENGTEYDWVREYKYAVKTEDINTICFYFGKDRVTYADLNTKITCQKKAKSTKGREGQAWKPVSVHVKKRKRTEEEEEKRTAKLAAIEA